MNKIVRLCLNVKMENVIYIVFFMGVNYLFIGNYIKFNDKKILEININNIF